MNTRKIAAHYVITGGQLLKETIITLSQQGEIVAIESNVENIDSQAGVEFYSGIIIPGTVNCHSHLEYSYVKGMIPPGGGLPEFIRAIIDIKYNVPVDDSVKIAACDATDASMTAEGIVAVADHNNNNYATDTKTRSSIYYHTFVEVLDIDGQSDDETFDMEWKRMMSIRDKGLACTMIPHANYTLSPRLLRLSGGAEAMSDGRRADGVASVHFKESVAMAGEGESEATLPAIGDNRDSVLLVHCIYASEKDILDAKRRFGDRLNVVPCPMSNMYIENRLPDIMMFRRHGLNITLGTDSLSSNTTISMVEEMKCVQRELPEIALVEVVSWATENGARALGIDDWAGSIEVGKRPGLVLLSNVDMETMRLTDRVKGKRLV